MRTSRRRFALEDVLVNEILERLPPIERALLSGALTRDCRDADAIDSMRRIGMALRSIHLSRGMSVEAAVAQTAQDYSVKRSTVYAARQAWKELSSNTTGGNKQTEELAKEVIELLCHAHLWR